MNITILCSLHSVHILKEINVHDLSISRAVALDNYTPEDYILHRIILLYQQSNRKELGLPRDFDGSVTEYEDLLIEQAKRTKINLLLLGPGINTRSTGARLRKYIASKCKGERNAIYGERDDLINAFKRVIGKYYDLCSYEFHLATKVDAIIIVPASPGSLVELGLFSLEDDIHPKTLVLFSSDHNPNNEPDFISLGPKKSYGITGATVETVDYSNKKLIWNIVDDFLEKMKAIKFHKKRMEL